MKPLLVALGTALGFALVACGGSSSRNSFDDADNKKASDGTTPGDFGSPAPASSGDPAPEVHEVYGHSADTLYKLDPDTKAVTVVGKFQNCQPITDIALDANSTLFGTTYNALYKIDKATATCTQIATGTYPNSLSFVPKGTVDPDVEALVGYDQADYLRIDATTGSKTKIGSLGNNMRSSGDVVSVKGGATYLTVKDDGACSKQDCLVEVDPASGSVVKNWGTVGFKNVFGLSFWAGKVYGFDDSGDLFEVTFNGSTITTSLITMPSKPSGLSFWGAGSTTSAPLVPTAH